MNESTPGALLSRAAQRVREDPFFIASALAAYQAEHALADAALAGRLGCAPAQLARLGLCRRPDADSRRFGAEVQQIAAYAGVQPLPLASLLREVSALEAFRAAPSATLLAARDAEDPE
jgi:hypothetical protein